MCLSGQSTLLCQLGQIGHNLLIYVGDWLSKELDAGLAEKVWQQLSGCLCIVCAGTASWTLQQT
jgi:hypothetical protein